MFVRMRRGVHSRALGVHTWVPLNLVGSKDRGVIFVVLAIGSRLLVSIGAVLGVLGIINMDRLIVISFFFLFLDRGRVRSIEVRVVGKSFVQVSRPAMLSGHSGPGGRAGRHASGVFVAGLESNLVGRCAPELGSCTETSSTTCGVPDKLVQVFFAHGEVILAVMNGSVLFPVECIRVLLIIGLLELVLRGDTMSVKAVAARGEATGAVLALVVLPAPFRGAWRWRLDITEMRVHGHTLPMNRNAMLVIGLLARVTGV